MCQDLGSMKNFADYKQDAHTWITLSSGEYYPDILQDACELYKPVLVLFGQLMKSSESSIQFFLNIADVSDGWMRIQLARVFRKYVSPETPVEMLKKKTRAKEICEQFGQGFRPIHEVQKLVQFPMKHFVHCFGNIKIEVKKAMI